MKKVAAGKIVSQFPEFLYGVAIAIPKIYARA